MNIKTDKELIRQALEAGCVTISQLAYYLRVRTMIARAYRSM